jgi:parallel beta-helix repeat protein
MKKFSRVLIYLITVLVVFIAGVLVALNLLISEQAAPAPAPKFFEGSGRRSGNLAVSSSTIIEVRNGQSVQEAVRKAKPGTLIRVLPGTYRETVYVDKDSIRFQGITVGGEWPTLEGDSLLNDAFLYSGNFISIEGFKIQHYKGNGIMGQGGNNFVISNNWIVDTGVYGIFPQFGKNGLIEHNLLTEIEDAAIYVGMSDNIDVRHNEVYGNVAGIEIENSRHALVEFNNVYDNTGGILAFITPGLPIKTCYDVIIRNNFVYRNNHANFGAPGSIVSFIPPGSGVIVMAADDVVIENNLIYGNDNIGIGIVDHSFLAGLAVDPDSEPNPDRVTILDNFMFGNGDKPAPEVKAAMATQFTSRGPDIIAVAGGGGSCIRDISRYRTFGLNGWARCEATSTARVVSYLLPEPVEEMMLDVTERGKLTYYTICSGCHAYNVRLIGPPTVTIQAMYAGNPKGIADFIANPVHKRPDYPEMPPQDYLPEETRMAIANYMLDIKK